jgi:hypothetical protein
MLFDTSYDIHKDVQAAKEVKQEYHLKRIRFLKDFEKSVEEMWELIKDEPNVQIYFRDRELYGVPSSPCILNFINHKIKRKIKIWACTLGGVSIVSAIILSIAIRPEFFILTFGLLPLTMVLSLIWNEKVAESYRIEDFYKKFGFEGLVELHKEIKDKYQLIVYPMQEEYRSKIDELDAYSELLKEE